MRIGTRTSAVERSPSDSFSSALHRREKIKARLYDFLVASPLVAWLSLAVFGLTRQISSEIAHRPRSIQLDLQIASEILTVAFFGLQIVLFAVRITPKAKEPGLLPRTVAAIGANLGLIFLAVPRAQYGFIVTVAGFILLNAGMLLSMATLATLGRSFSVFPQARKLVTSGPYRIIRHPLYLSEFLATLGAMWQFKQPWSVVIALLTILVQIPRMHFEEDILRKTFAEYATYEARTKWRLIPFVF
jgi:protein-S-isoprenylcysteine O-methyltransferase Ste14